ncbi:MAG: VOC family protein [Polyangiaceae bacterium]|nr:VOC family protein [Polyangiaceae bacterium]
MTEPHELWPRISSAVFYDDAGAAIDWLCKVFGFEVRLKVEGEGGRIEHSELTFGDGVIMIGSVGQGADAARVHCKSPRSLGGANTQSLCVYVDDVDAHCQRARDAGAQILREPATDDYGDEYGANRSYEALDLEGHHWWFMRVARDPKAP